MESMKKKKAKQMQPPPSPTAVEYGGNADRISALDDDLCELILRLAHLDVRELVRTSVLSKRWRFLWKHVRVLDFFGWPELKSAGDVQQYIRVVDDVLEQRAGTTLEACIEEVKIPLLLGQIHPLRRTTVVEAAEVWIQYAMHHQVKGLQLNLRLPRLPKRSMAVKEPVMDLDEFLPSSPKLESMRLGLGRIEVRLPRTAVFTSLRDLTLEFVRLARGSGHLLARLLSSACCPSLQKLHMMQVDFEYRMDQLLELTTPKLLYLKIKKCDHLKLLTISAPGLKELTYCPNIYLIHGPLPCVWRLGIHLITHKREEDDNDYEDENSRNICLLKHCSSSVTCLLVDLYVPRAIIERGVDLIKDKMPQLPNVTSLLVNIHATCQWYSFGDGMASLLTRFKNLEYLSLQLNDPLPYNLCKMNEYYSEDDADSAFTCNHRNQAISL